MSENMDNYLESLNESQREAVEIVSGATLVLAGAGSGKTRVLTYKLLHLLVKKILTPNQIIAVTFTNKAAAEMKSRVSKMVNFPIDRMWLGTFHSLSLKILRKHYEKINLKQNFVIIDSDDQLKLIKQISRNGPGWDGTYNGTPLPSTDYWFIVSYQYNGEERTYKAHFTMKR